MNLPYPDDFDEDDRMLHESLAPLRDLKPTGDWQSNIAHLPDSVTTTTSLESSRPTAGGSMRWILAIAASLLVGIATGWTLRGSQTDVVGQSGAITHPVVDDRVAISAVQLPARSTVSVETDQFQKDRPTYYAEELYLCGVGVVQSTSRYQFAKETR